MKTYILRIYRFKEGHPQDLVGIIEEVGQKGKKAFTNYDKLWETLTGLKTTRNQNKLQKGGETRKRKNRVA